jgi:hypothetical protein
VCRCIVVALRMCFGNVVAERDAAENEKFTKIQG